MKVVLFGAGKSTEEYLNNDSRDVVAILDNQECSVINRFSSIKPEKICRIEYDSVIITPDSCRWEILGQLVGLGVDHEKIQYYCPSFSKYRRIDVKKDEGVLYLIAEQKNGIKYIWRNEVDERVATYPIIYGEYEYACPYRHQTIIDVGMNIGIASLNFAANEYVDRVISFEPFRDPYVQALENFKLNDSIGRKICAYNFGLGFGNGRIKGLFFDEHSTASRTTDVERDRDEWKSSDREVEIKDAGLVLKSLLENDENAIILKMNCEGGEYDIMKSLAEQSVIDKIAIMMIETHDDREAEAMRVLDRTGFSYFWQKKSAGQGFIRAVKSR